MLRIKNWESFQHYKKDRGKPPWIKLYRALLDDKEWFDLNPEAAKILISLWLIAAEKFGELPAREVIAFRLRISSKELEKALSLCTHWIIDDASNTLANCYQDAIPETETETYKEEAEKKQKLTATATRLPKNWFPSEADLSFIAKEKPELNATSVADGFRDYWISLPGSKGMKLDWSATWRNWVRRQLPPNGSQKVDEGKRMYEILTGRKPNESLERTERVITGEVVADTNPFRIANGMDRKPV